ncbi:ring finger domain-containing protein [Colletotrichum musicola]|uniref:RBR-type E3 ubiquitin transferase n=1 Tax=Colletotrichum musicola TaxID=2175873 RepID=A0A8H6NHK4_9PEZI|nr:ring finger domain-containing protein [Colletotrichum musicola]
MFAPTQTGRPPSYHSSTNVSRIRFDDLLDPPPDYDYLWANTPLEEEQRPQTQAETNTNMPGRLQLPITSLFPEVERGFPYDYENMDTNNQERPLPPTPGAERAFSYGAVSASIMADFDVPLALPRLNLPADDTAVSPPPSLPPQRGYLPTAASILEDFDLTPFSPQSTGGSASTAATTPPTLSPPTRSRSTSQVLGSNNPYLTLLEQKEQAMTVSFLRSQDAAGGSRSADLAADDFSFGQRYQRAADTTDVVVSRQRVPANDLGGSRECPICAEMRDPSEFPRLSITLRCTHPPESCLQCLQMSIKSDLNSKMWTEIQCPECREPLEYVDIQKYADEETFARYEALALRAAMAEAENFIWCTSNCGSGQLHISGGDQPIVTCLHCGQRSCFTHNVAWHENLTCEDYDSLLRDPENFRSRIEMEHDELDTARRAQEDADRAMAQGLMAEQQADLQRREARERAERERVQKAVALARTVAARRKAEEQKSQATLSQTTKACPGCGWAIERSAGCSHMTCK